MLAITKQCNYGNRWNETIFNCGIYHWVTCIRQPDCEQMMNVWRKKWRQCSEESKQGGRVSTSVWPVSDRAPCQPEVFLSVSLDPGLAPTWETHTKAGIHTNTISRRHIYAKRERETEREVWSATENSDWKWQAGGFTGSRTNTRKPAPWIYLFDFASSIHRSLRVRATVFNCWPQTPHAPSPAASSSRSLWEYKLWKEILFICLFPPLPL